MKKVKIPPDGGYGWVIVFANALSHFITTPLVHCFGLIFNVKFTQLGFTATQSSFIINMNAAFGMMTGLINGVLLKTLGCRKVALLAALFLTLGVVMTAFSSTFLHFVLSYGVVTSLGMGLSQSSFGLAVNLYFVKKRSYAVSLSETLTGFGPIIIPQVISALMTIYPPEGVTLIFGGICAHVFAAAALLQPVDWHQATIESEDTEKQEEGKPRGRLVTALDLDLLKDPVFVNIMMGLALAIFAELNFTVLTPFMLHDYGLDTKQIATFLSVLGGTDIVFRFFAPHIARYFTTPPRWMYAYSLFLLMLTRFTFLLSRKFYVLILIALGLGIAKGVRKVYMSLVIPDYVSLEKLATASGMEMMMNGICIMIGGPVLGIVRDVTGSYSLCVVIMNCVTFTTISMWLVELLLKTKKFQCAQ